MNIVHFFDRPTGTLTYLVLAAGEAIVIDPLADYDAAAGRLHFSSADRVLAVLDASGATLRYVLETHCHADHISACGYLHERTGAPVAVGAGICAVQQAFHSVFDLEAEFATDGSQFDRLLADGEVLTAGALRIEVMNAPGHTSDSVCFRIGEAVFVGDTLFAPARGTARCDFPGGDAATLYRTIRRLYELPGATPLYLCHDYPEAGAQPIVHVTVAQQRAANVHLREATSEAEFVALRDARDAGLAMPALIIPAIQINLRAGRLPPPAPNGTHYLKTPINRL